MIDETALEKAYNRGLYLEKCGDLEGAAAAYREALAIDPDDHGGAAVRLAAIGYGMVPRMAPKAYVATLFDQHADVFDMILVDQLGYDVPLQLREQLVQYTGGERVFSRLLDLGCGTGLSGDALDDLARKKTGVDISKNMIEIACEKGDYDRLFVGDILQFLEQTKDESWDIIVATDVLPYIGELESLFVFVARHLVPDGIFGFSSEMLDDAAFNGRKFMVGPHQRFAHQPAYIRSCLSKAGLEIADCRNIVVRAEQGTAVPGQLFLARHKKISDFKGFFP